MIKKALKILVFGDLNHRTPVRFSSTPCTFHKGFSGFPAAVSRSFSRHYHDRESHANPYVTCNFPLANIKKKTKYSQNKL